MDVQTKKETLHRLIKATYLSSQKFASTLGDLPPQSIPEKLSALIQYFKKKEGECKEIEEEIEREALKEEQKEENEVVLQIIDYLGRKGLTRTAEKIIKELYLESLTSIDPYIDAKESIKKVTSEKFQNISVSKDEASLVLRSVYLCWKFSKLCASSREEAVEFCKKHRTEIPEKYLPLLVLSNRSALFHHLSEECSEKKISLSLSAKISKINLNNKECMFFKRISLGISGFTTPACKEKEKSLCPGCSIQISKLAKGVSKSTRSTTKILCTKTKQLIPEDTLIFSNTSGEVFCRSSLSSEELSQDDLSFSKAYRRCYFV